MIIGARQAGMSHPAGIFQAQQSIKFTQNSVIKSKTATVLWTETPC